MEAMGAAVGEEELGSPLQDALDSAQSLTDEAAAAVQLAAIVADTTHDNTDATTKVKEEAIYALAKLYAKSGSYDAVVGLLALAGPFFANIAKAKVAKIVRSMIELVANAPGDTLDMEAELCLRVVAWCVAEKRTFLRQRVESRLVAIDYSRAKYDAALKLVNRLLRELKKLDDKQLLVETHLSESRIHAALRNVPKAKAALTASRTNANAIYVAPRLQADLDEMSGTLHCEEADYDTSYSYFLEAYEAYDSLEDKVSATRCLKYMLLCRILVVDPRGAVGANGDGAGVLQKQTAASASRGSKPFLD